MKFAIVLNGKIGVGQAVNTTSHLLTALVEKMSHKTRESISVIDYKDADGNSHYASKWPQIILKAKNSNQIRKLKAEAIETGLNYIDFTDAMTIGDYQEQLERSSNTKEENLEYYGAVIYGPKEVVADLTRKFSLYY